MTQAMLFKLQEEAGAKMNFTCHTNPFSLFYVFDALWCTIVNALIELLRRIYSSLMLINIICGLKSLCGCVYFSRLWQ
jgi:hypothetical protein